jgi:hypothetical protein
MKRVNLDSKSFHDSSSSLKDRALTMRFLIETLTARNLTRDKIRIDRIKINLMILVQSLLTINQQIEKFSNDDVFFSIYEIFQ